jgi:predicted nucleic acid-binding protein
MIAVDTNILVYAHREDSSWHEKAVAVVRDLAEGRSAWAIPWPCLHEFLAIVTHPRIYTPPTPLPQAVEQVEAWLESPHLVLLSEASEY